VPVKVLSLCLLSLSLAACESYDPDTHDINLGTIGNEKIHASVSGADSGGRHMEQIRQRGCADNTVDCSATFGW